MNKNREQNRHVLTRLRESKISRKYTTIHVVVNIEIHGYLRVDNIISSKIVLSDGRSHETDFNFT